MTDPGDGPGAIAPDFVPAWADVQPTEVVTFARDPLLDDESNGEALRRVIVGLDPGQRLEIGAGTYSIATRFDVSLLGTESAPIRIAAADGARVVITRPDDRQNVINVGNGGGAAYVSFEGLEVVGGSTGFKLYSCVHVRIDGCHIHDVGGVGIAANSADTAFLYLTRNHIHDTDGAGEGMYLGANHGQFVTRGSVIARNHVHDTRGSQGDGIELKQGSYGNTIAYNLVHDTNYPCILVYGTGGLPRNLVEGNVLFNSGDNVMQVQGDATVRNNLILNGGVGFASTDHQGQTQELTVVHNTIVNAGRAVNLSSWNARPGMVFANNVVYSRDAESIRFANGSAGVVISGNVTLGRVVGASSGFTSGTDLDDFAAIDWTATERDASPSNPMLHTAADPAYLAAFDLTGAPRTRRTAGCLD